MIKNSILNSFFMDHPVFSPKQMLQRLPMAPAQLKAGSTSQNFLNEIRRITYYFYRAKNVTEKVYNNIMISRKL